MKNLSKKRCLLDTNILVALINKSHKHYHHAREIFQKILQKEFQAVISSQTLFELVAVLVHGYKIPRNEAVTDIKLLSQDKLLEIVYPDYQTIDNFFSLIAKEDKIHIADIFLIATAISSNIELIITLDKDFEKVKSREIKIYNPLINN